MRIISIISIIKAGSIFPTLYPDLSTPTRPKLTPGFSHARLNTLYKGKVTGNNVFSMWGARVSSDLSYKKGEGKKLNKLPFS